MAIEGIVSGDFTALSELKAQAVKDAKGTAPEVAKQFEGIFLQAMLKSMRLGVHFVDESSPFRGRDRETFQDMLDAQYASNIASTKSIGLADMLAKQIESVSTTEKALPTSTSATTPMQSINTANIAPTSVDDFVRSIWPKAKEAASIIGLDPKILMAQAALETGWGKFVTKDAEGNSSNNLFNIKSTPQSEQESVTVQTTEYVNGMPIKTNASFRKYSSIENSFSDYVSLIKDSERYQTALASAGNPETYMNELHKAGYATDPDYSAKILSIYHGDELNQAIQRCEV